VVAAARVRRTSSRDLVSLGEVEGVFCRLLLQAKETSTRSLRRRKGQTRSANDIDVGKPGDLTHIQAAHATLNVQNAHAGLGTLAERQRSQ
jgi:hypothetical protein